MTDTRQPDRNVRRSIRERSISPALLIEWKNYEAQLDALLVSLGIDETTHTVDLWLTHADLTQRPDLLQTLAARTVGGEEQWLHLTLDDKKSLLALTVRKGPPQGQEALALYVEIHSRLISWWLTVAWRSKQLADATALLSDTRQTVPAAACARALIETAAAFWADASRIAGVWSAAKAAGPPSHDKETISMYTRFTGCLREAQVGGKFNDKAPALAEVFKRLPRVNAMTEVDKLARQTPGDLQSDYQWLCNTVHPSVGTTLVFSAPPLVHETGLQSHLSYSGTPIHLGASEDAGDAESIPAATARAASLALRVISTTLNETLMVIDDIGLTTGAPSFADFSYWRNLDSPSRNDQCPCRSGRKSKQCHHDWGAPAPGVSLEFPLPT